MMGQGANVTSYAALVLGEEIVNSDILDARLLRKVEPEAARSGSGGVALDQHHAAAGDGSAGHADRHHEPNPTLANKLAEDFNYPDRQWGPCLDA